MENISVFHKNYEQITTTLILHQAHLSIKTKTVKENEKRNKQKSENLKGRNSLFRSHLKREVKKSMFDFMTLLWVGLGGASLAFAFIQYAYSYRKKVKTEPC
jgi:hypothetical protein